MVDKKPTWEFSDRVQRRSDVFDDSSPLKKGVIRRRYSNINVFGNYPELYEVLWDSGKIEEGFLPHGLDKEIK